MENTSVNIKNTDAEQTDILKMIKRCHFSSESVENIKNEALLPSGLVYRLHVCYPKYSGFFNSDDSIFKDKK